MIHFLSSTLPPSRSPRSRAVAALSAHTRVVTPISSAAEDFLTLSTNTLQSLAAVLVFAALNHRSLFMLLLLAI